MRYLLLSVLIIFAIGIFTVEDAFGIQYDRVNIQLGTDIPGCESSNSCHSPNTITIGQGEWIKWKNLDIAVHTITSGSANGVVDGKFDSGLMTSGSTFSFQFTQAGTNNYFCMVHPWAVGTVIVKTGTYDPTPTPVATPPVTTSSKFSTNLELFGIPSQISGGDSLTLSGMLTSKQDGFIFPVSGATIYMNMEITFRGETKLVPGSLTLRTGSDGMFSDQSPNLDLPPEIDEKFTINIYAVYKGNADYAPSTSYTQTVIVDPNNPRLPPGVSINAQNFESETGYGIMGLYDAIGNPQKKYSFAYGDFGTSNKKIIRGDRHDLLVIYLLIENNDSTSTTFDNRYLSIYDGKDRKFTPAYSTVVIPFAGSQKNPDFDWNEDCSFNALSTVIQPGLTGKVKFCFEIPKNADHFKLVGQKMSKPWNNTMIAVFDRAYLSSITSGGGGCLIATAAFGSEMAPQVQFLRELRDNTVLQTESGTSFMTGFNQFYYSFSPYIADYERENPAFKETVKLALTPLLTSLTLLQYVDIDSESEMLGYGIGVILLNIGMYFVAPAVLIMAVRKRI